jgi:hypothetical protein
MNAHNFSTKIVERTLKVNGFLGVDLTNPKAEVQANRSPDALNMFINKGGNLEKRGGFTRVKSFIDANQRYNEVTYMKYFDYGSATDSVLVVQLLQLNSGTGLPEYVFHYRHSGSTWVNASATLPVLNEECKLIPIGDENSYYSLILGGYDSTEKIYLLFWNYTTKVMSYIDVTNIGTSGLEGLVYTPTTHITRSPDGKTTTEFEQVNLISFYQINEFYGNGTSASFYPSVFPLASNYITSVWVKSGSTWVLKTLTTHYTVNTTLGCVTFTAGNIPPVPSVTGEDNVRIQFRNYPTYFDKIWSARSFGKFGFNGMRDYIFLGGYNGNGDMPKTGEVWLEDKLPLYLREFDNAKYSSKVLGYSNFGEYQTIHCERLSNEPTLYLRSSGLDASGEVIFPVKSGISGVGVVSGKTFATLRDEPLWLSEYGVTAVASSDVSGKSSAQDRSFYISNMITGSVLGTNFLNESVNMLQRSLGFVYDNRYYLFVGDDIYVADPRYISSQADSVNGSYQYEWFRWRMMTRNMRINAQYEANGVCYVGGKGGIYSFQTNLATSSIDTNIPISEDEYTIPYWETDYPYQQGQWIQSIEHGVRICKMKHTSSATIGHDNDSYWVDAVGSGVPVVAYWTTPVFNMNNNSIMKNLKNLWVTITKFSLMTLKIYYSTAGDVPKYTKVYTYSGYDSDRFRFSNDQDPIVVPTNRSERKFLSIQFKVESDDSNPFALLEILGSYTESGIYRG